METAINNSNIRSLIEDFLPRAINRLGQEDKDVEMAVAAIRPLATMMVRHPFAMAFAGIDMNDKSGPRPKMVLISRAGADLPALKAKFEEMHLAEMLQPVPAKLIQVGDALALVVGYDRPGSAIPGPGAASLASSPEFMRTLSQAGKDGELTVYIDVDKLLPVVEMGTGMAGPEIKSQWDKARDASGIKGVHHLILTSGLEGKNWTTQAFIDAPAPRTGAVGLQLNAVPLSKDIFDAIPVSASIASAGKFNLGRFVDSLRAIAAMADPNSGNEFDHALQQANQATGVDIRKDLLGSFGDEWALYNDPGVGGNGMVGMIIVNHLTDAAKAEASIIKVEDFATHLIGEELKKEKDAPTFAIHRLNWGGITIHYMGLPLVEPAWTIRNGNLYVGLYPETVVAAARRTPGKDKSISDNPAFAALMKKLGDHSPATFQFADLPRLVPETYPGWLMASHLAGIGDMFGVPAPVQILPPLQTLTPMLSASGSITWTDDLGAHFRHTAPFPMADLLGTDPTSMSGMGAPLAISILLPALNKVREEALKAKSSSNLRQIGAVAITYADAHNGKYPKDISELADSLPPTCFVSPRSTTSQAPPTGNIGVAQAKAWVAANTDYVWNGAGRDSTTGTDEPLAWEDPAKVSGGINILFGDFHVAYYPMPQAMEIIQKARKSPPRALEIRPDTKQPQ